MRAARCTALIPYVTAGYPSRAATVDALGMLESEGADFIEVGIPFSDPLADGPVIQHSTHEALRAGMTVAGTLEIVREAKLGIPTIAFSYVNPILAYGVERFLDDAEAAGFSGILLTDLPAGADREIEATMQASALDLIRLVAVTTGPARLKRIATNATGFLYLIARLGVTGAPTEVTGALEQMAARLHEESDLPVAVGFGIGTGEQARRVAGFADGVVVGSALVERLGNDPPAARQLMRELREALHSAPVA